jgi:hypothetical protein
VRAVMTNAVTDREDMNEVRHQLLTMTETRRLRSGACGRGGG